MTQRLENRERSLHVLLLEGTGDKNFTYMYCDCLKMLCTELTSDVLKLHFVLHCTLFRVNPCMTCGGQFPEKPYEANLPDHYPRDEFTMLPKFLPRRKDFKNAPYAKVRVCKQEGDIRIE